MSIPGSDQAVITVGACDLTGSRASFSSIGPTVRQNRKPDLLAPGIDIISCDNSGNGYVPMSGTSMAAPVAAGAAALLIQALQDEGFSQNPGVMKAALMKTAKTQSYLDPNYNGRGMINIGAAKDYVIKAPCTAEKLPMILATNPGTMPYAYYSTLPKGQRYTEQCTVVSSNPNQTTIELSPSLENYCSASYQLNHFTENVPIEITIPKNSPREELTGIITFSINGEKVHNLTIELTLVNNAGEFGLDLYHCNWPENHFMGQYCEFMKMTMMKGIAINIINEPITEGLLEGIDCLWMPDPCNIEYPKILEGNTTSQTVRPISESEKMVIIDYVASGGGLFINFPGKYSKNIAGEAFDYETNTTVLSGLTTNWGIGISGDYRSDDPVSIAIYNQTHPVTEGINFLSYYGTHLSISQPSSTTLVRHNYQPVIVSHEEENAGKILISSTAAFIENDGYLGVYEGLEQNSEFCEQILAWFVNRYTLQLEETIALDRSKIDFELTITKLGDPTIPPNPPIGQVTRNGSGGGSNLTLNYIGLGRYSTTYIFAAEGNYTFRFSVEDQSLETSYFRDVTQPQIVITQEEMTVTSETEIVFEVTDNYSPSPIVEVELNEETLTVTKVNASTFKVQINPENYLPGTYELIIQARDDKENLAIQTINLIFPDATTITPPSSNLPTSSAENIALSLLPFSVASLAIIKQTVQKRRKK
ncbi:MAG: S8 family serine peptidase [Candidatus Heimdallarchaeota archaeon]|nr:S8 family serine peptidase [Candidatus Heimdallarchaeota archaeon]